MNIGELVALMKQQIKPEDRLGGSPRDYAQVYALDEDIAVKIYRHVDPVAPKKYGKSLEGNARWEYFVGKQLYAAELNVPKYFGLASASFSDASTPEFLTADDTNEDTWYLFMQRIHATSHEELTKKEREILEQKFYEQTCKAYQEGFQPIDCYFDHNALFDRSQQKVYLIDFVRWKRTIKQRISEVFF